MFVCLKMWGTCQAPSSHVGKEGGAAQVIQGRKMKKIWK